MNVLVTRPDERGQKLVEMLAEQQIFALHQPLFSIEAGRELPQLPSALARMNSGDYVFAVSKHAIDFAHHTLQQTGFRWRADLHYFAVGQNSAKYFADLSEQSVKYPIDSENSEGLLQLAEMQAPADKNLLILRADSGRELLAQAVEARGANVQYLECYQRVPLVANLAEQLSLCKRVGVDTIVITSGEILTVLCDHIAEEDKPWLFETHLVVVSPRIARAAQRLGWPTSQIRLSDKADNQSLFNVLMNMQKN